MRTDVTGLAPRDRQLRRRGLLAGHQAPAPRADTRACAGSANRQSDRHSTHPRLGPLVFRHVLPVDEQLGEGVPRDVLGGPIYVDGGLGDPGKADSSTSPVEIHITRLGAAFP
jgi:hypothetical protein